jgi:hypothetical protein
MVWYSAGIVILRLFSSLSNVCVSARNRSHHFYQLSCAYPYLAKFLPKILLSPQNSIKILKSYIIYFFQGRRRIKIQTKKWGILRGCGDITPTHRGGKGHRKKTGAVEPRMTTLKSGATANVAGQTHSKSQFSMALTFGFWNYLYSSPQMGRQ